MEQLTMFPETKEEKEAKLYKEIKRLHEFCDKMRKSQYAQINNLKKICIDNSVDLELLKKEMCKWVK